MDSDNASTVPPAAEIQIFQLVANAEAGPIQLVPPEQPSGLAVVRKADLEALLTTLESTKRHPSSRG